MRGVCGRGLPRADKDMAREYFQMAADAGCAASKRALDDLGPGDA